MIAKKFFVVFLIVVVCSLTVAAQTIDPSPISVARALARIALDPAKTHSVAKKSEPAKAPLKTDFSANELSGKDLPSFVRNAVAKANRSSVVKIDGQKVKLDPLNIDNVIYVKNRETFISDHSIHPLAAARLRHSAAFVSDTGELTGNTYIFGEDGMIARELSFIQATGCTYDVVEDVLASQFQHERGHQAAPDAEHGSIYDVGIQFLQARQAVAQVVAKAGGGSVTYVSRMAQYIDIAKKNKTMIVDELKRTAAASAAMIASAGQPQQEK